MLTHRKENDHYLVFLNGEFIESCYGYNELKEVYARYGINI